MWKKIILISLIWILSNVLISYQIYPVTNAFSDVAKPYVLSTSTLEISNHTKIVNKELIMAENIIIQASGILEIINSTLDFSSVVATPLIENHGQLIVNSSKIISNLDSDWTYVILSDGNLTIVNSEFINKHLPVDFENNIVINVCAVGERDQEISVQNSYFENFTKGLDAERSKIVSIFNNTFRNCPYGVRVTFNDGLKIEKNKFFNSLATAIDITDCFNVIIKDNYVFNEREKMITTLEPFGDITIGISISGFQNHVILNNTIGNAYKSIVLCHLTHSLIENNYIFTNGSTEGEIQIEHADYITIRKNVLINQWDSIEIYNSRHLFIERNYIKDGVTGIRVEREDEYGGIDPVNVTIQYNVLVNSGFISTTKARNVKITNNLLNSSDIVIMNSENLLIYNNTIYNGTIGITDSKDIIITDNFVEPPPDYLPIELENCQNVTQTNNILQGNNVYEGETSESRFAPPPYIFGIRADFLVGILIIIITIGFLIKKRSKNKISRN